MSKRRNVRRRVYRGSEDDSEVIVFNREEFHREVLELIEELPARVQATISKDWKVLDEDDKIEVLQKHDDIRDMRKNIIYRILKKLKYSDLKMIFFNHICAGKSVTNEVMLCEIVHKVLELETPLEKRRKETENLQALGNVDDSIQFVDLCNITVHLDVLKHIFTFIPRNLKMITRVGRVCQHFYVTVLSTWPHVNIRKTNMYEISLLVLKSVTSITLFSSNYSKTKHAKRERFTRSDLDYLLKKLSPSRLRTITTHQANIFSCIGQYQSKSSKDDYSCQNVRHLNIETPEGGFRFKKGIFPNLQSIAGVGMRSFWSKSSNSFRSLHELGFLDLYGMFGKVVFPNIKVLSFRINTSQCYQDHENIKSFLQPVFPNVTECRIYLTSSPYDKKYMKKYYPGGKGDKVLLFNMPYLLSSFAGLKKLHIEYGQHSEYSQPHTKLSKVKRVIYPSPSKGLKVDEITIKALGWTTSPTSIFDINLEDMMENDFFSSIHNTKKFTAELILHSRKRNWTMADRNIMKTEQDKRKFYEVTVDTIRKFIDFLGTGMVKI